MARLLDTSRERRFRLLALTFTNKAADEMMGRLGNFAPGLEDRAFIGTFHSFCGHVLRLTAYISTSNRTSPSTPLDHDRTNLFEDALRRAAANGHQSTPRTHAILAS